MIKGKGDCEDFVIAKYFSLLALEVPDSQLRLIYVARAWAAPPAPSSKPTWCWPITRRRTPTRSFSTT
ncbi:hypothetical protein LP420_05305 [Massilia sp. B-10]|nr:hypothetical protein LP420_05305 [Massilia sp. B-10]